MPLAPSPLLQLLRVEAQLGGVGAKFLVNAGRVYTERRTKHPYGKKPPGQCYLNAFELALAHPELSYCEGRALSMGIVPLEHAWCVDADGKVVDVTREEYDTVDYVGVAFSEAFLEPWVARRRQHAVLAEMFPSELAKLAPAAFLANPTAEQLAGAVSVFAHVNQMLASMPLPDVAEKSRRRHAA